MTVARPEPGPGGGVEAARARHPTRPRHPDLARMTGRLADRLASEGHPWPDLAAAVMAERGRAGLNRESFAEVLGVSEDTLAGVEDGSFGIAPGGLTARLTEP